MITRRSVLMLLGIAPVVPAVAMLPAKAESMPSARIVAGDAFPFEYGAGEYTSIEVVDDFRMGSAVEPDDVPQLPSSLVITNGTGSVTISLNRPAWVEFEVNGHRDQIMPIGDYEIRREFSETDWFKVKCFEIDAHGNRTPVNFDCTTKAAT